VVTALPVEPAHEDPLDPQRILGELPVPERDTFLAQHRRAVDAARDPAGWKELRRFLRLWALRAVAISEPGFYDAQAAARAGANGCMLLDEALRQHRTNP
jgi:Family of unknown function (DUF6247)